MRARGHGSAPPLWVWFAVLGLLVVLLGLSVPISHKMRLDHFNLSRLQTFNQTHGKIKTIPKVVVIGTSLTRNAFYKDEAMERFATDRGKPIRFLRFTESSGHLVSFKEIAALALEAAPEVICFEAALFAISRDGKKSLNWQERIADHRFLLFEFFRQSLLDTPFFDKFIEVLKVSRRDIHGNFNDAGLNLERVNTYKDPAHKKPAAAKFRVRDFSEGEIYYDFFEAAAKRGVRIVFIDLSRSKDKWEALPPMIEDEVIALMKQYKTTYGITYIPFPCRLSSDYFVDEAHFGNKGRKFYSGWFVEQLPIILSKGNE